MLSCGLWRVLSPGKQSSGPGAAGSCGAESRLDTTKTRKHNETDWLAAAAQAVRVQSAGSTGPRPQWAGPAVCPGWAGADNTQETGQGTPGVRARGCQGAHADLETLGSD